MRGLRGGGGRLEGGSWGQLFDVVLLFEHRCLGAEFVVLVVELLVGRVAVPPLGELWEAQLMVAVVVV